MTGRIKRRLKAIVVALQRTQPRERRGEESNAEPAREEAAEPQVPVRIDAATPDPAATVLLRLRT